LKTNAVSLKLIFFTQIHIWTSAVRVCEGRHNKSPIRKAAGRRVEKAYSLQPATAVEEAVALKRQQADDVLTEGLLAIKLAAQPIHSSNNMGEGWRKRTFFFPFFWSSSAQGPSILPLFFCCSAAWREDVTAKKFIVAVFHHSFHTPKKNPSPSKHIDEIGNIETSQKHHKNSPSTGSRQQENDALITGKEEEAPSLMGVHASLLP
jgi:hypothetical protein